MQPRPHFDDLEDFVDEMMADAVDRLTDTVFADRPGTADDLPRDRLAAFVDAITVDSRLARPVFVETFGSGRLGKHRHALVHRSVTLLLDDFLSADQSPNSDPTERRLAAYSLSGATGELLVAWVAGEIDAPAEVIVDHLVRLCSRMAGASTGT